jgi:hypothetical protein
LALDPRTEYAWNWFELHARQRLQNINFFLALLAALLAGYGAVLKDSLLSLSLGIGLGVITISALFYALDRRIRTLLHIGERALKVSEKILSALHEDDQSILLTSLSEESGKSALTYGKIFMTLFSISCILGFCMCFYSASQLIYNKPESICRTANSLVANVDASVRAAEKSSVEPVTPKR